MSESMFRLSKTPQEYHDELSLPESFPQHVAESAVSLGTVITSELENMTLEEGTQLLNLLSTYFRSYKHDPLNSGERVAKRSK
jgi:hypothetical protein